MAREMPHVEGVEHRFAEANGIRIHYAEAGPPSGDAAQSTPVVMLHGWPQHWYEWRDLIGPIAERRRVICPDLRGLGWSEAPRSGYEKETLADDLLALLDVLGIDRVCLIGHDWGAWSGFLACLREPDRFERFLALGIAPPFARRSLTSVAATWRLWYQLPLASPFGARIAAGLGTGLSGCVFDAISRHAWGPAESATFLGQFAEAERARASVAYYRTFQLRELPALVRGRYARTRLEVPTRLLFGTGEAVMSPAMLEFRPENAADLVVELVPGAGHFIADERPDLVLERARELFGSG
ncbi:MAG: alpha/beta fold hydrolase [Solirubrobacterales bacterium]